MLANQVTSSGKVFGFDIQESAIKNSSKLVEDYPQVQLFLSCHSKMQALVPKIYHQKIKYIMFNFGYLPHGDQTITTKVDTSISAINQALKLLNHDGTLSLLVYPGHSEGLKESIAIQEFIKNHETITVKTSNNMASPYLILAGAQAAGAQPSRLHHAS